MRTWKKEEALQELSQLRQAISGLRRSHPYSVEHTRWLSMLLQFLEEVFGRNSRPYVSIQRMSWKHTGTMLFDAVEIDLEGNGIEKVKARYDRSAFSKCLDMAEGLLLAAEDQLTRADDVTQVYEGKDTGPEASVVLSIINLAGQKLRKAIRQTPSKEKEIQDAFETLLLGANIEYSRETDSIEYSSKTYTPDFTVKKADLGLASR